MEAGSGLIDGDFFLGEEGVNDDGNVVYEIMHQAPLDHTRTHPDIRQVA